MANFCPSCGFPTDPNKNFCENCGYKLIVLPKEEAPSSLSPAAPQEEASAPVSLSPAETEPVNTEPAAEAVPPETTEPQTPAGFTPTENPFAAKEAAEKQARADFQKKKTNIFALVGGIFAIALITIGGMYFMMRNQAGPQTEDPDPVPVKTPDIELPTALPTAAPSETPSSVDSSQGTADFLLYDIACDDEVGEEYRYPAVYEDDMSENVYGTLQYIYYDTNPVNDTIIEFGKENDMDLDGYTLVTLNSEVYFNQEDARDRGVSLTRYTTDYYDVDLANETFETFTDSYGEEFYRFEVNCEGQRKYVYFYLESQWSDMTDYILFEETATYLIPGDYDGVVHGFVNPNCEDISMPDDPDDVHLFRLNVR